MLDLFRLIVVLFIFPGKYKKIKIRKVINGVARVKLKLPKKNVLVKYNFSVDNLEVEMLRKISNF